MSTTNIGLCLLLSPFFLLQFCKRPCFHDEYLPAFNKPNVNLVHTDGRGVERFTPRGIVADGVEYVGNITLVMYLIIWFIREYTHTHHQTISSLSSLNNIFTCSYIRYELDCIVFATGFKAGGSVKDTGMGPGKVGYEVTGRGGVTMTDKWKDGTWLSNIGLYTSFLPPS